MSKNKKQTCYSPQTTLIHPSSVNHRKRDVFTDTQEGGVVSKQIIAYVSPRTVTISPREEKESEDEDDREQLKDYSLSATEVKELDYLTGDIVRILNRYAEERMEVQSRTNSRPATPMDSPSMANAKLLLPLGPRSGTSTPYAYNSRPGTPSRLSRQF